MQVLTEKFPTESLIPKLTEAFARKAPFGADGTAKHWDSEIKGLALFVGKRSKTWCFQKDVGGQAPRPPVVPDAPRARLADYVAAGWLEDAIDTARAVEAEARLLWRDAIAAGQVIAFQLQGSSFGLLRPEVAVQALYGHPLERSRRTIEMLVIGELPPSILSDGDASTAAAGPASRKGQ